MNHSRPLPEDVKSEWLNPIRRLQSVASKNHGLAVLSISIMVNSDGIPVMWTKPKMTLLEPKQKSSELLDLLTQITLLE